ncbi:MULTISPECIES: hypothetical protein [Burkholderia]|uniref:hypothetical protein n=1 Tax=Burkholderia TaxID=32008 RepID=UPI000BBD3C65|nr:MULTISPECIES: hypothetical protein [Burkholderia]ATF89001.1 hypothetical protein CO712_28945 [Burkholderia gladioli pv. gladioli]MBJ9661614.1 hypothetical protein [Burkholderia gladioli]MBJ9712572.1 hypothetical protein [Burkholderia gladioli]MBU9158939.1 hypothetical protein [Burkholderia gladioli]MBU9172321.1 hypothetical protein [Burkholderia gladioli]
MKQRSLFLAAALSTALLAPPAFAGLFVGVGVPVVPVVPAVPVYVPPPVHVSPPVVVAAPVVRVPPPVVLAPVVVPRAYVAPAYPVVRVRAAYWPHGVVVVH